MIVYSISLPLSIWNRCPNSFLPLVFKITQVFSYQARLKGYSAINTYSCKGLSSNRYLQKNHLQIGHSRFSGSPRLIVLCPAVRNTLAQYSTDNGIESSTNGENSKTSNLDLEKNASRLGYKDVTITVSSMRAMSIANKAFSLGTNRVRNAFYEGRIRVNDKRLRKKKDSVEESDIIDIIEGFTEEEVNIKRILIHSHECTTKNGNETLYVRVWKNLTVPRLPS